MRKLSEYDAEIEYIENSFANSERNTDVEIAIVYIDIPQSETENEWWQGFEKAAKYEEFNNENAGTDVIISDNIKKAIQLYNIEVKSTMELIKHYNSLKKHISSEFSDDKFNYP